MSPLASHASPTASVGRFLRRLAPGPSRCFSVINVAGIPADDVLQPHPGILSLALSCCRVRIQKQDLRGCVHHWLLHIMMITLKLVFSWRCVPLQCWSSEHFSVRFNA